MTVTAPARRPPVAARRVGYVIAAVFHAVVLFLVNVSPGWQAVPFLTADTPLVLGLVNVSLAAGLVCNLVYVVADPRWLRALGDLLTTGIGVAVLVRIWQVFPFNFSVSIVDWTLVARMLLIVAIVGSAIGIVAQFVSLVRMVSAGPR